MRRDGLVTMVFDTKHAISMQTDNGAELIIHIGLDTVQLKGQYFDAHVAAGDKVKQGDLLLDFDIDKIKEAGYDVIGGYYLQPRLSFQRWNVNGMEVMAEKQPSSNCANKGGDELIERSFILKRRNGASRKAGCHAYGQDAPCKLLRGNYLRTAGRQEKMSHIARANTTAGDEAHLSTSTDPMS